MSKGTGEGNDALESVGPDGLRLTQAAGLDQTAEEWDTFWLLNLTLILLGAAIVGVAFYFLDIQDNRLLYNPWTYVVATPVVLLLFSALLSTVASRLVEKSMQIALLLSILIHLLLMAYAVNVVIFSRMWPDMLDSLAAQREQLQRKEALHARQYYQLATAENVGSNPDYLRYVPTEHQPTDAQPSESPAVRLAREQVAPLASPSPEQPRQPSRHLLERSEPSASVPMVSEQAAALSRSELSRQRDTTGLPAMESTADLAEQSWLPPTKEVEQPQPLRPTDSRPQRRSSELDATSRQSLPPVLAENVGAGKGAAGESGGQVSQGGSDSLDLRGAQPELQSAASAQAAMTSPQPAVAEATVAIPRAIAGGRVGSAAEAALPVKGEIEFAAPEVNPEPAPVELSSSLLSSRAKPSRIRNRLPSLGMPQSPRREAQPRFAWEGSGRASGALPERADSGAAAVEDTVDLSGSRRDIQRAAPGILGRPDNAFQIGLENVASSKAGVAETLAESAPPELQPTARAGLSRRQDAAPEWSSVALGSRQLAEKPGASKLDRSDPSGNDRQGIDPAERANRNETESRPNAVVYDQMNRREMEFSNFSERRLQRTPLDEPIEIPDVAFEDGLGEASQEVVAAELRRLSDRASLGRRRTEGEREQLLGMTPLEIDADLGPGGFDSNSQRAGPLLPRRNLQPRPLSADDLTFRRFSRREVGGPLASGNRVARPTPAFKQRLERLRDQRPTEETLVEPQTELAIERGLEFLAEHQRQDGSWRLQDFDTQVLIRSDTAATGLSLLAFQGAGYTHKQFKYAAVVRKAVDFLVANQKEDGDLYIRMDPASDQNAWLYSHGIASLALCEAYGMTQDPQLRKPAQRAIDFMVASQDPDRGGWRYRPGLGTDTSVTGWFMMAFKSGQLAGLDVKRETFDKIEEYLNASQASSLVPHLYRYNPYAPDTPQQRHGREPTPVMTSVGLLMRLYFGWRRERPPMQRGTDYLLEHPPAHGSVEDSLRDTYYWYYATQVLFHMGDDRWKAWHDQLYPLLIEHQITSGPNTGSWDPLRPTPDLWARYGGRLYVTTMNLLSLEVSYRHLPLYDATAEW